MPDVPPARREDRRARARPVGERLGPGPSSASEPSRPRPGEPGDGARHVLDVGYELPPPTSPSLLQQFLWPHRRACTTAFRCSGSILSWPSGERGSRPPHCHECAALAKHVTDGSLVLLSDLTDLEDDRDALVTKGRADRDHVPVLIPWLISVAAEREIFAHLFGLRARSSEHGPSRRRRSSGLEPIVASSPGRGLSSASFSSNVSAAANERPVPASFPGVRRMETLGAAPSPRRRSRPARWRRPSPRLPPTSRRGRAPRRRAICSSGRSACTSDFGARRPSSQGHEPRALPVRPRRRACTGARCGFTGSCTSGGASTAARPTWPQPGSMLEMKLQPMTRWPSLRRRCSTRGEPPTGDDCGTRLVQQLDAERGVDRHRPGLLPRVVKIDSRDYDAKLNSSLRHKSRTGKVAAQPGRPRWVRYGGANGIALSAAGP